MVTRTTRKVTEQTSEKTTIYIDKQIGHSTNEESCIPWKKKTHTQELSFYS